MDNGKPRCSGCGCKVAILFSIIAIIVATVAYFYPKQLPAKEEVSTFDEKVKSIVIDTVKQNPQLLMNAMGEGIAKQREAEMKQIEQSVTDKSSEISKLAFKFGKLDAKVSVICFIDPLEKSCIEIQKQMLKLIKAKSDVCFKLLPVAVLGDDSVTLSKVYFASYEKGAEKAIQFIENIISGKTEMDKKAIESALKTAGLNNKEIEGMMADCEKKLIENGKLAESLKIPVVPAMFIIKDGKAQMLKISSADQFSEAIEKVIK